MADSWIMHYHFNACASGASNAMFDEFSGLKRSPMNPFTRLKHVHTAVRKSGLTLNFMHCLLIRTFIRFSIESISINCKKDEVIIS